MFLFTAPRSDKRNKCYHKTTCRFRRFVQNWQSTVIKRLCYDRPHYSINFDVATYVSLLNPLVIKADIAKMFRQIKVSDADSEYQRIVWRTDHNQPIKDYRLTTVTLEQPVPLI